MMLSGVFTDTMQEIPGVIRYIIMAVSGVGPLWYLQMLWLLLLFTIVAYGAWCTTKRKTYLWHGKSRGERTNRDPGKSQKAV